jgi:hypothetical protein
MRFIFFCHFFVSHFFVLFYHSQILFVFYFVFFRKLFLSISKFFFTQLHSIMNNLLLGIPSRFCNIYVSLLFFVTQTRNSKFYSSHFLFFYFTVYYYYYFFCVKVLIFFTVVFFFSIPKMKCPHNIMKTSILSK